jgi:Transcription factor WhiB.
MHRIRGVDTWVTPLMEKLDLRGEDWRDQALCAQCDPELFFPGSNGSVKPALRICHDCPVMTECRAWGDATETSGRVYGILGGETGQQRVRRRAGTDALICQDCGRPMRQKGVSLSDAPGTVPLGWKHERLCVSCVWRRRGNAERGK